jgi:hypothetical protein
MSYSVTEEDFKQNRSKQTKEIDVDNNEINSVVMDELVILNPKESKENFTHDEKDNIERADNIDLNRPWNMLLSLQLKKLGEKAIAYKWLHDYESGHYERCEKICGRTELVSQVILGTFTGAFFVSLVSKLDVSKEGIMALLITQLVFMMFWSLVYGIRNTGHFTKRSFDHKYVSTKFNELYLQIQGQFILPVQKRVDDFKFYGDISKKFTGYMFTAPSIRKSAENKYLSACKNGDIYKPIMLGDFEKVEVIISDNSTDINVKSNEDILDTESQKLKIKKKGFSLANLHLKSTKEKGFDEGVSYEINRWLRNF